MPFKGFTPYHLGDIVPMLTHSGLENSIAPLSRGVSGAPDCLLLPTFQAGDAQAYVLQRQPGGEDSFTSALNWVKEGPIDFKMAGHAPNEYLIGGREAGASPRKGWDHVAFDHARSGRMDHLLGFRRFGAMHVRVFAWTGSMPFRNTALRNDEASGAIDECWIPQLVSSNEYEIRVFAVDWESSGYMDHVFFYLRGYDGPSGGGAVFKRKPNVLGLELVWQSQGEAWWDEIRDIEDLSLVSVELDRYGRRDSIVAYGKGTLAVLQRTSTIDGPSGTLEVVRRDSVPPYDNSAQKIWAMANPLTGQYTSIVVISSGGRANLPQIWDEQFRKPFVQVLERDRTDGSWHRSFSSEWVRLFGEKDPQDRYWDEEAKFGNMVMEYSNFRTLDLEGVGLETHVVAGQLGGSTGSKPVLTPMRSLVILVSIWELEDDV